MNRLRDKIQKTKKLLHKKANPKKPKDFADLVIKNPWVDNEQTDKLHKKIDTIYKKDIGEELDSEDEISSDSDSDQFDPIIKPPPPRKAILPDKKPVIFKGIDIIPIPTMKSQTPQRPLMEDGTLPKVGSITLINGSIGSGKTNLLYNMLANPLFYGKDPKTGRFFWDQIFWLTNSKDEIVEDLINKGILPRSHIKHMPEEKHLKQIIKNQKEMIKKANGDWAKVPITFVIFDDIIDSDIIKTQAFKTLCFRNRHLNISVICLGQYLYSWDKKMRQQSTNIICFNGNAQEKELITEMFCPSELNKKQFSRLIGYAWEPDERNQRPFLHIAKKEPYKFRKTFAELLDTNNFIN